MGKPLITFTEKARPYLIPQTDKDLKNNIQRVRVAEEFIEEIVNVKMEDDGQSALVEFNSVVKGKTPFFKVSGIGGVDENLRIIKIYYK